MKKLFPQQLKNWFHWLEAVLANVVFGFPSRKLKVIGVTGTNGKTTTVQMIGRILEEAGKKVAVSSTVNFKIGGKEEVNKTKFTTLRAWKVQSFIKKAVEVGCDFLVLEVGSHALDQHRVWGVDFSVAVVTNVTREHLDYHKTMEEYREVKMKLFKMLKSDGVAVVNLDMERPEEFLEAAGEVEKIGFASQKSKVKSQKLHKFKIIVANNIKTGLEGTTFELNDIKFKLKLPGLFNAENALAAIGACQGLGLGFDVCAKGLEKVKGVPGRMDYVENDLGLKIIIDYALTPDSMEKLGELTKNYKLGTKNYKLIWVFGSCGDRDRGKRPIMGEIVGKFADFAIVTNEDPYTEDPAQIIDEVFAGLEKSGKKEGENSFRIFDRKEAIKKAINLAKEGDVVLVTGKGAEETMAIGKKRVPWNDRRIVEEILEMKNEKC